MKRLGVICFFLVFLLAFVWGCSSSSSNKGQDTSDANITGLASKGPISNGTVKVYALKTDGSKGDELGSAITKPDGSYGPVNIGRYRGDVVVEITGGTYKDEVTKETRNNDVLKGYLQGVSMSVEVYVTPFTDLACQLLESGLVPISAANHVASELVGFPVHKTRPVDITDAAQVANATREQKEYGLALAAVSQMIQQGKALDVAGVIRNIKEDFLVNKKLDETGPDFRAAIQEFLGSENNKSGISSLEESLLAGKIKEVTETPIDVQGVHSELALAQDFVKDLRNTALSIYNFQDESLTGAFEVSIDRFAREIDEKISPDLRDAVKRLGWIIDSADTLYENRQDEGSFVKDGYTISIQRTDERKISEFTVTDSKGSVVDVGRIVLDDADRPKEGTLTVSEMKTKTGILKANVVYSAEQSQVDQAYSSMRFRGDMKVYDAASPAQAWLSMDFSEEGRGLSASFARVPDGKLDDIYPTDISFEGRIVAGTARMDGKLEVSDIFWADKAYRSDAFIQGTWQNVCVKDMRPKKASFRGLITELKEGVPTGIEFEGSLSAELKNAETLDGCVPIDENNFPKLKASFDGRIQALPVIPGLRVFLEVQHNEYKIASFNVIYQKTETAGPKTVISGEGAYNDHTQLAEVSLQALHGIRMELSYNENRPKNQKLEGRIVTPGGKKLAEIYTQNGLPVVKFIDGYIESLM